MSQGVVDEIPCDDDHIELWALIFHVTPILDAEEPVQTDVLHKFQGRTAHPTLLE
jgi:hypothetical protein